MLAAESLAMRSCASRLLTLLTALTVSMVFYSAAFAADTKIAPSKPKAASFEGFTKTIRNHTSFFVNPDGTAVETHDWEVKVLSEQGLEQANTASVSYSEKMQRAEIIKAYTLKADGRRIDVPKANYQVQDNRGKDESTPMFSDIATETVAFPSVAVGDSVVMAYRIIDKEATFPGQFSFSRDYSKFVRDEDETIDLSAPAAMHLYVFQRGVEGGELPIKDGRRRWSWSYKSPSIAKPEPSSVDPIDYGPLIVAGTFKDYGALAAAYAVRTKDKVVPDDKIKQLANDLTVKAHTPRDQAKALYDWITANVQYAANRVAEGSVVPHPASQVLRNRMGDCKDHATLFEAMLDAKGIASTQVLINSGSAYTLPPVANIDVFDHVITYIPSLDLYADSTTRFTPFGQLPFSDADKPVVHTTAFSEIRHTPPTHSTDSTSTETTDLTVNPDGSADGISTYAATGFLADRARASMHYLEPDEKERVVKLALERNGYVGTGSLTDTSKNDRPSYTYKFHFADAINIPGPGALAIHSPIFSHRTQQFLAEMTAQERTVNFVCYGYTRNERYTVHLPSNVQLLAVPRDVTLNGADITYKSSYHLDGNTLVAERLIIDQTPGNVCTPAQAEQRKKITSAILRDFRTQLVYR